MVTKLAATALQQQHTGNSIQVMRISPDIYRGIQHTGDAQGQRAWSREHSQPWGDIPYPCSMPPAPLRITCMLLLLCCCCYAVAVMLLLLIK